MRTWVWKAVYCVMSVLLGLLIPSIVLAYLLAPRPVYGLVPDEPIEVRAEEVVDVGILKVGAATGDFVSPLPMAPKREMKEFLEVFGGHNKAVIARIIACESGWYADASNPGSSAEGLCQFIDSTWVSTWRRMGEAAPPSKLDPYDNIRACVWLYDHDGGVHWEESRHCWSK